MVSSGLHSPAKGLGGELVKLVYLYKTRIDNQVNSAVGRVF